MFAYLKTKVWYFRQNMYTTTHGLEEILIYFGQQKYNLRAQ